MIVKRASGPAVRGFEPAVLRSEYHEADHSNTDGIRTEFLGHGLGY